MKYKHYYDASHGWIAVKKSQLKELGIENKITEYSYMKGETAYLEEDCDATTLVKALEAHGIKAEFEAVDHGYNSPIIRYPRYKVGA